MAAAHEYACVRPQVLSALQSSDVEIRSAAVATCNEANDGAAHDLVVALFEDSDAHVRGEVFEYLAEFPQLSDSLKLLDALGSREHVFLATCALQKLYGTGGPVVTEEDDDGAIADAFTQWRRAVSAHRGTA